MLGDRFVRLQHWGRVSKTLKETVLEVIDEDKPNSKMYSASGFGEQSQWFKNISLNKDVILTLKNKEYDARARVVSEKEAEEVLIRYANKHPKSMKGVARLSGYEIDGGEQSIIEFSKIIKIVEFKLNRLS